MVTPPIELESNGDVLVVGDVTGPDPFEEVWVTGYSGGGRVKGTVNGRDIAGAVGVPEDTAAEDEEPRGCGEYVCAEDGVEAEYGELIESTFKFGVCMDVCIVGRENSVFVDGEPRLIPPYSSIAPILERIMSRLYRLPTGLEVPSKLMRDTPWSPTVLRIFVRSPVLTWLDAVFEVVTLIPDVDISEDPNTPLNAELLVCTLGS